MKATRFAEFGSNIRFSLLHASYHRERGICELVEAWLEATHRPQYVEYIVACDEDDPLNGFDFGFLGATVVRGRKDPVWSTAVRNWNNAASVAQGHILAVISDDLFPCQGWDETLWQMIGGLAQDNVQFAAKIDDGNESTTVLVRHPVISRSFYSRFGLFDQRFKGVYADDDFTLRAFWNSGIVDCRSVKFEHRHPELLSDIPPSASQGRNNRNSEYRHGLELYRGTWSPLRRSMGVKMIKPEDFRMHNSPWGRLCLRARALVVVAYFVRLPSLVVKFLRR